MRVEMRVVGWIAVLVLVLPSLAAGQPVERDEFETGDLRGWGPVTIVVPDGGPEGAGDGYLLVTSSGNIGSGSRMTVQNESQWRGDYLTAGRTRVAVELRCLSGCPLEVRLAMEGGPGAACNTNCVAGQKSRFVTPESVVLPSGGWQSAVFDLLAMTRIAGSHDLHTVLADVSRVRFISAVGLTWHGDLTDASLGLDDIEAIQVPEVPTLARRLQLLLGLLLAGGAVWLLRRS